MGTRSRVRVATAVAARSIGTEILLTRLRALSPLASYEIDLIRSLGDKSKLHAPHTTICPREDGSPHSRLIVSGWACRPRMLPDGRRQMLSVLLPGDLLGDRGERRPLALTPAVALTTVRTVSSARLFDALAERVNQYPGLCRALDTGDRIEEEQLLDHVVRLGCQTALQRTAHCLIELYKRLAMIGFTHDGTFPMPLTQETLGDLLGLSLVHVNRVLSKLKREGLVEIRAGVAKVNDFGRLSLIADQPNPLAC